MKTNIFLLPLCLALSLFFSTMAAAATDKPTTIRVAASDDSTILTHRIINTALKRMGYQMLLNQSGVRTALAETEDGDQDLLAEMVEGMEQGYNNLIRIPISFSTTKIVSYVRSDSKLQFSSWTDLNNMRVAFRWQNKYTSDNVPKYASKVLITSTYDELWEKLINNEADVVVMPYRLSGGMATPKGVKVAGTVTEIVNYPYINRKHAALVPLFTQTLLEMQLDGTIDQIKNQSLSSNKTKTVMHITSYSLELGWERQLVEGVRKAINANGSPVAIFSYNLNANRMHSKYLQRASVAGSIHAALLENRPDVIVASDNDALEFVRENYYKLFVGTPVVFCGVNNYSSELIGGIEQYTTGCTESISVSATVQYMLRLYPKTKKIYIVNDYTNSGRIWQNDIKNQLDRLSLRVQVQYNDNIPKTQLLNTLASFNDETLVLIGSYFTDSQNVFTTEEELQRQFSSAISTPLFVLISSDIGYGAFGGMISSANGQGTVAGKMASRLLAGQALSSIPIIYASESVNRWIFDYNIMEKYGISESRLPEGSMLINKPETPLKNSLRQISLSIAASAFFILCTYLILHRTFKKKAAKELAASGISRAADEAARLLHSHSGIIKQLESIMQKAPFAFIVTSGNIILEANEYSRSRIGMTPGKHMHNFYKNPSSYSKAIQSLENRDSVSGEITIFNMANGESHRHHVNYVAFENSGQRSCLTFAIDIEELERQKDYTRRSQEDLQKVLDAMPTAMAIINTITGTLEYANKEFLNLYGYDSMEETIPDDFKAIVEQIFAAWQGKTIVFEYRSKVGNMDIDLKMYADQIIFKGRNCIVLIGQDITAETKQAAMLTRAAGKEKEANMLKSIFLANMSHEIRTPMNAIIGLSQLALMKEQSKENSDFFHKIRSSTKNLLTIINDILDFSKIEAEKLDLIADVFSLEDTIVNTFLVAAERLDDKPVEILLDISPDIPYFLVGDSTRLWQVLKNLLDNSVKYTMAGRVILSVSIVESQEETVTILFHVKDTGLGMTEEQLSRLFAPFEQFHRNNTKSSGTGLGMAITKKLVDMMHGKISVESKVGQGTDFYVTIPFKHAENHNTIGNSIREIIGNRSELLNSILLVDDDEYSLMIMSSILKNAGISSVCASSATEAIQLVHEHEQKGKPFCATIIDYMLGDEENGIDLAHKINEISQNTKLLLVTAYLKRIIPVEAVANAGFKDIIEKPYVVSTFLQKVCSVLPEITSIPEVSLERYPEARVLLCEDNDINQLVAIGMLEHFGITPVVASDGAEALDIMERETFDLVLMDIMMPVMNGNDATRAIRQSDKPYKNVPIVAMTANVMVDEVEKYLSDGMNAHLEKPIDIEKFQEILARYLTAV